LIAVETNDLLSRIPQPQPQEQPVISMSHITAAIHRFLPPLERDHELGVSISFSKRRKTANLAPRTLNILIAALSAWASSPESKLLIVSGSLAAGDYHKHLAAELIQLLQNQTPHTPNDIVQPVLWVLYKDSSVLPEPIQLVRQLVSQLLLVGPEPIPSIGEIFRRHEKEQNARSASKVDVAALSIEDWIEVFALLAAGCGRLFIVVDLESVCRRLPGVEPYMTILRTLVSQSRTRLKIIALEYGRSSDIGSMEGSTNIYRENESVDSGKEGGVEMFVALKRAPKSKRMMRKGKWRGKKPLKGFRAESIDI
jgi:hypothetical protein